MLGGSGFLGRHLVAELVRRGIRVTVPSRHRERAKHLIVLPTVDVVEADIAAAGTLERLLGGSDAVVNLVGTFAQRDFDRVHAGLPAEIASACRASGVRRFLHVSALGAAEDAPSAYQRSKARGEQAALGAEGVDATVFRPSVVFGPEDRFLNLFARLARFMPVLALACPRARFQPVYVGDVALAMAESLDEPVAHGKRYDLCGPREYTLEQLVDNLGGRRVARPLGGFFLLQDVIAQLDALVAYEDARPTDELSYFTALLAAEGAVKLFHSFSL